MKKEIRKIGIAGAGTMGSGIATVASLAGYEVILYDIRSEALDMATIKVIKNMDGAVKRGKISKEDKNQAFHRISFTDDFSKLTGELMIEAILEKFELKKELFQKLAAQNSPECILSSNTSSIPITRIAAVTPHPERVVGLHFFNPPHIMKLVEVISALQTDPEVSEQVKKVAERMGKRTVKVKDAPGFIVNRVARPYYLEALKMLEERVAPIETIDRLMTASGFKMGPFRLMDLIGIDSNHYTSCSMYESFYYEARFKPSRIQQQMTEAGKHGRKSGEGFYKYD